MKPADVVDRAHHLGVLDAAVTAEERAEGERVIAAEPWPTRWEDRHVV